MSIWLKISPIVFSLSGCAAVLPALPALSGLNPTPAGSPILTTSTVSLSKQNYKIIKANAIGGSEGFSLLGLFTLVSPSYDEAFTNLYQIAGVSEGKAQALANVVYGNSSNFYLLFSLPKITVRADVIEFTDAAVPAKTQETEMIR